MAPWSVGLGLYLLQLCLSYDSALSLPIQPTRGSSRPMIAVCRSTSTDVATEASALDSSSLATNTTTQVDLSWSDQQKSKSVVSVSGPTMTLQQPQPITVSTMDEPSTFSKLQRRIRVFALAARVFLSYKVVGFREKLIRFRFGLSEDDEDADDHPEIREIWDCAHAANARRLLQGIESLEGFWVKLGQYLSSRADIMPPQYLNVLSKLQDGMPSKPFQEIQTTLEEQLSEEQRAMIAHIDTAPLSTASLAQVHRATLTDDQKVVIKAQHRGVATLMRQDMQNLRTILEWLSKSDPNLDYTKVVEEYTKEVQKELNFRLEAQNMKDVRQMLEKRDIRATVPQTIPELTTEKILVMDYCEGFPIRDVESLDHYHTNRTLLLERVCTAWAAQIHCLGTFNSDPHSGNILVSTAETDEDASVPVLLDFGLTKRLDPGMRLAFSRLVHASYETDVDGLLQSFEEMGLKLNRYDPFEDMAVMQKSLSDTVPQSEAAEAKKQRQKEWKVKNEAMRQDQGLKRGQKLRNPVDAWPSELIFFTRVTAMLRGLCSRLEIRYPYLATMAEAAGITLREAVPEHEWAVEYIHPSVNRIDTTLQRHIRDAAREVLESDHAVGLQLCIVSDGSVVANVAAGTLGAANPRPVTPSSLFNVFSVSKAVLSTGVLVMLQERGISVDDPIAKHWPAFGSPHPDKECITIRHALSHQAGLANAFPPNASIDLLTDWAIMKDFIAGQEAIPAHVPGMETHYHYLTFAWILGGLIEEVTGEAYEKFLEKHVLHPLGIADQLHMGGLPEDAAMEELAVLTSRTLRNEMTAKSMSSSSVASEKEKNGPQLAKFQGREQMLNPSVFNMRKVRSAKIPSANGHASAFALAQMMNAVIAGNEILSSDMLEAARTPQRTIQDTGISSSDMLDNSGASFGLGFQLHSISNLNDGTTLTSIGHAGFGGSIVIGIPELKLSIAFTTNQLNLRSIARDKMIAVAFRELGLKAPRTLIES